MALERNPLRIESLFADRIFAIRKGGGTAEEISSALGALLGQIDTHISLAIIDQDFDEQAAWESARAFVQKEIS